MFFKQSRKNACEQVEMAHERARMDLLTQTPNQLLHDVEDRQTQYVLVTERIGELSRKMKQTKGVIFKRSVLTEAEYTKLDAMLSLYGQTLTELSKEIFK